MVLRTKTILGLFSKIFYYSLQKNGRLSLKTFSAFLMRYFRGHQIRIVLGGFFYEGRYWFNLYLPGFPSKAFNHCIFQESNRLSQPIQNKAAFNQLFLAITKKCSLNCEHCFEWPNINSQGDLSEVELIHKIEAHQNKGLGQIFFSGGEPLNRFSTLLNLIHLSKDIDCWIVTSGWGLTEEKALRLKNAGLVGIVVSLDDFREEQHNSFRGHDESYYWALQAINNANKVGLISAFSLCATNEFINPNNLENYIQLAKNKQVKFIQILEPKPEGAYLGQNVTLSSEKRLLLERFFLDYSSKRIKRGSPILAYPDFFKRKHGCRGAQESHRYIDPTGEEHACPFCKNENPTGSTSMRCKEHFNTNNWNSSFIE